MPINPIDKADADTARNASVADMRAMLRLELKTELLLAMANGGGVLRAFSLPRDGRPNLVKLSLIDCLADLLDAPDGVLWRALVNVLQHSECPEVGAWRLLAAEQYAERADDIAEVQHGE